MNEPTIPNNVLTAAALRSLADDLHAYLDLWSERDDTKAQSEIREAASHAGAVIDTMLAELHAIRAALVTEIRRSDDAAAARADALLARIKAEREAVNR